MIDKKHEILTKYKLFVSRKIQEFFVVTKTSIATLNNVIFKFKLFIFCEQHVEDFFFL